MSDMDALVELAAEALDESGLWPKSDERVQEFKERAARAALHAIGLPALLERVEAAEKEADEAIQQATNWSEDAAVLERDRDALATKVAQLREQVAYLERSRDNVCETAERDRGDALRELSALRGAGSALLTLKDGPRDDAYYAAKEQAWADLRAALTEGAEVPKCGKRITGVYGAEETMCVRDAGHDCGHHSIFTEGTEA